MSILSLRDAVESSVLNIAPEKSDLLGEVFDKYEPSFDWTERAGQLLSVEPGTGKIHIPPAAAELIWAAAHLHWVTYTEFVEDQKAGKDQFDWGANARQINARLVFDWALENFKNPPLPRDSELPAPCNDPLVASDVHVANEVFLSAIAWILHHEIAHLRLEHASITTNSRIEEKDADLAATQWIFSGDCNDKERGKRAIGLCVAILVITSLDLETGTFADETHPKVFERFDYCLEAIGLEPDHIAYSFSVLMIRLQLLTKGHLVPESGDSSFKDMFSDHLLALFRTQSD